MWHFRHKPPCKFFATRQGCRFGEACKYSHESKSTQDGPKGAAATGSKEPGIDGDFRKWQHLLPRGERITHSAAIGWQSLQRFFKLGWSIMTRAESDVGVRQALILKLATDPGIQMIKAVVDLVIDEEANDEEPVSLLEIVIPLFRTISHHDVVSSLILETPLLTICNFLFGPNGRRLIPLFRSTATTLFNELNEETPQNRELLQLALISSLAVLSQVVELCQTAQILDDLGPILETFQACLQEEDYILQPARQSLNRLQRRCGLGKAMPDASHRVIIELKKQPRFTLELDPPGDLSSQGPRHDNDHDDIRSIQILPTWQEIQSQRQEYLPTVDTAMNVLHGLPALIDRHFRLLREDSIGGLRDAVHFETDVYNNQATAKPKNLAARNIVHQNANIMRLEIDKRKGLQVVVDFTQPLALRNKTERQRQEWWTDSRQMQLDALVCLVSSSGRTIFFSVCDPSPTPPSKEKSANGEPVNDETTAAERAYLRRRSGMPSLHTDPERAALALTMVEFKTQDVSWLASQIGKFPQTRNTLVEFPGILLPSFKPTLEALQDISESLDLPFQNMLAPEEAQTELFTMKPPAYARRPGFAYDLSPLTGGEPLRFVPGQAFDHEKLEKTTLLDPAQQLAALHALSNDLALIQGPPGTGKSYTGVAIIKTLLKNRKAAKLGPIVCVCYTNHALDQLLESLVKESVDQIIRVGSRSKSELLQKLNLYHVAQEMETTKAERHQKYECHKSLDASVAAIDELLMRLNESTSEKAMKEHLENNYPRQFRELFAVGEDNDGFQEVVNRKRNQLQRWLKGSSPTYQNGVGQAHNNPDHEENDINREPRRIQELKRSPLNSMTHAERKLLYGHWVHERASEVNDQLLNALEDYNETKTELDTCKQELHRRCLSQAHVIGVTTSGLARNLEVLRKLPSKVVVCEEAGEVLEAHILTALLPSIEHAILIGDHEQLRPQICNHELTQEHLRGERFALDVSLFERLVKPRPGEVKLPFTSLRTQRRMHPSIAELIRQTLYPALEDHASVFDYPEVEGIRKRLFWLDHEKKEDSSSSQDTVKSYSKSNSFEVEMVAAMVSHLIRQGAYDTEDIVILTPYLGQLRKIKQRLRSSFEIIVNERDLADLEAQGMQEDDKTLTNGAPNLGPQKTALSKTLRVATVDNFQGEEAKVVVVSLVRSNDERRCGFLKTSNRINVLLSRARHGMYIIGNFRTASSIQMWADVIGILEMNGNIGTKLALCCPRHVDTPIEVQSPDDFAMLSPEGGCARKCVSRLLCGHACINQCHSKALHEAVRCLERCQRLKPGCTHPCPHPCGDPCDPKCMHLVPNVQLPCGHICKKLECHKEQAPDTVSCQTKIERKVPFCNHDVMIPCCNLPLKDSFQCPAVCGAILPCGHSCTRKCKDCKIRQDGHIVTESHGECKKICERPFTTCNHDCRSQCHGDTPCQLCRAPCEVRCSHSRCAKMCHEPCVPCVEDCAWACPHEGKCQMPCAVPCDLLPCSFRCKKKLKCSHRCPSVCGEVCPDSRYCQLCADESVKGQTVDYILGLTYGQIDLNESPVIVPACGHIMTVDSMDGHMDFSRFFELADPADGGERVQALKPNPSPFSTDDLKRCPICRSPLRDINRYGRIVRRAWIDEATKKFIVWANAQFVPLTIKLEEIENHFRRTKAASEVSFGASSMLQSFELNPSAVQPIKLKGNSNVQFDTFCKLLGRQQRYKAIVRIRCDIARFLNRVSEAEQPFSRIYDLVQDARLHRGLQIDFAYMPEILQTRSRMLATVLLLRTDYAILLEMLTLYKEKPSGAPLWMSRKLDIDLTLNRQICEQLIEESRSKVQPANEVEGLLYWARFVALERGVTEAQDSASELVQEGREQLLIARDLCEKHPDQTKGMLEEVEDVQKMLRDSTFYATVTNEEKAAVYAAMANELRGTGHWYYCANGHPFTIGECGMPMQTSVCPQCGAPVGGQSHRNVEGVTRAADLDAQFANMRIR